MLNKFKAFLKSEKGAETLEYIAIATVIILAGAAAYGTLGISGIIGKGMTAISGVMTSSGG